MPNALRWVIVAILVLAVVGMIGWARGTTHHHGSDVGALAAHSAVSQALRG